MGLPSREIDIFPFRAAPGPERWRTLMSTNAHERINCELKLCFRDVGSMKGDHAASRNAVLVSKRLNEHWQGTLGVALLPPIGMP